MGTFPAADTIAGAKYAAHGFLEAGMSYTLRGRLESRFAAAAPWCSPRRSRCTRGGRSSSWLRCSQSGFQCSTRPPTTALPYQAAWLALPLGALELQRSCWASCARSASPAPLGPALGLFGLAWLSAQALGLAVFPRLRLSYAEDGGELGRTGNGAALAVALVLLAAAGFAYATRPPTVHLSAGVHQGPLVIDRRETLVGDRGAVVRGGIVVRASHVTIRNVIVSGAANGIDVMEGARHVRCSIV